MPSHNLSAFFNIVQKGGGARGVKLMFKNVLQIQYDCDLQVQNDGGGARFFEQC